MNRTSLALLLALALGGAVWLGSTWLGRATDAAVEVAAPAAPEPTPTPDSDVAPLTVDTPRVDAAPPATPAEDAPIPTEEPEEASSATRALRVRVVGPDGEAVPHAPVHLVSELSFAPGELQDDHSADTGVSGVAVLEDSTRLLDMVFRGPEEPHPYVPERIGVRCGLAPGNEKEGLDEDWVVWIEEEPAPGEVVRVPCPPLGWILVEVKPDPLATERSAAPFWVQWIRMKEERRTGLRGGGPFEAGSYTQRIGPFAAGWDFALTLSRLGRVEPLEYRRVVVPPTHGEVLRVVFEEPPSTWITGVALLPSGEAFAGEQLRAYLGDPDAGATGSVRILTDDAGGWNMGVPRDAVGDRIVLLASGPEPAPRGEVAVALAGANPETIDLGEVVIHPRQSGDRLLAAGRVRAADGTPLGRAGVTAYVVTDEGVESRPIARGWTDSRGDYELVTPDEVAGTEIEVYTWSREYLRPEPLRVPVGSRAVDFTLLPGGSVTGEVLMDTAANPEQIVLRFEGGGRSRTVSVAEFQFQERGAFAGLVPGSYEIRFEIRKTDWVLLEAHGELLDTETLDLGPLDLRGKTRALELHLTDANGAPVAGERFELVGPDHVGHRDLESDAAGHVRCLVPTETKTFLFGNQRVGVHTITASSDPIELTL